VTRPKDFIEGWYNPTRRHSSLEFESPLTFERRHAEVVVARMTAGDSPAWKTREQVFHLLPQAIIIAMTEEQNRKR
jgi:hypothetical protein